MPTAPLPRRPVHRARIVARYLLLLLIPIAILLNYLAREVADLGDVQGFSCVRPAGWGYAGATVATPQGDRIELSSSTVREAIGAGNAAPIFVLSKYRPPHRGLNPIIGVNVAYESAREIPSASDVLSRSVAEVQARSGEALEIVEAVSATEIARRPGARVVLASKAPAPGKIPDKLVVLAVVVGRTSIMIAASGGFSGDDAVESELAEFAASFSFPSTEEPE